MKNFTPILKSFCIISFCILSAKTYSQTQNRITVSSGISSIAIFTSKNLVGTGSHEGTGSASFGMGYARKINNSFSIETGVGYSFYKIESTPSFTGQAVPSTKNTVWLLSIPLYGNYTFLKYLFVNAGAVVDFETKNTRKQGIDSQSGIGLGFGVGGRYNLKKLTLLANPFFLNHAVIPFVMNKYPERLAEIGVKFGVGYNF